MNGTVCVLFKTRFIFPRINGPIVSSRLAAPGSPRMEVITIACVYIFTCVFVLGSATPVKTEISEVGRVC